MICHTATLDSHLVVNSQMAMLIAGYSPEHNNAGHGAAWPSTTNFWQALKVVILFGILILMCSMLHVNWLDTLLQAQRFAAGGKPLRSVLSLPGIQSQTGALCMLHLRWHACNACCLRSYPCV